MSESLTNVILSNPTVLSLKDGAARSWIQLARTGSFVSNRYGKFSITKTDLAQMFSNFSDITPKAPTELPIDYDHLSMDPKKPGDGIAAGWIKKLQLRDDGNELYAEVEWTPDGAQRIANQEYRFVSPSFVKDHVHKDGTKIGTTLLAAAVTNHPFLEGMRSLTLYNFGAHGDLALSPGQTAYSLAEIGQRIMIAPGNARTQDEIGGTFEIAEVIGDGDDAFVSVKDAAGMVHKWFRMTELLPASTVPANPAHPSLQPGQTPVIPAQMPQVPVQPVTQAMNPAQAQAAQAQAAAAAAGLPGAALPGAQPPGAAPAAGATPPGANPPPAGAQPNAFAKDGEPEGEKKKPAKENEGATGGDDAAAAEPDAAQIDEMLKKAMAMLAPQQAKGIAHMMFTLRNDKNEEIKVSDEQLAAAGIKIVPEGSTAIPKSELAEMKGTITNLSSTVDVLKADNEQQAKDTRLLELRNLLGTKLRGGFMTKVQHDTLLDQFKDVVDLSAIKAIVATFTSPVITLNKEHGTGADNHEDKSQGEQAQEKILALSNQIAKEKGVSLSDAVKLAGAQLATESEAYREHYANTTT